MDGIMETTKQDKTVETGLMDFQKFTEKFSLTITKIGVECRCGKYFNIHLGGNEKTLLDIEPHKLVCGDCQKIEAAKRRQRLMAEIGY